MMRSLLFVFVFILMEIVPAQSSGKVSIYKGNQSFKKQNFDDASYQYLKAIEKNQKDYKAHYNLGNTLYKKNQYADAIASYQNALKNTKNLDEKKSALYNLGNAQFKNNQKKQAVDSYKQALKIDPNNQEILKNLRIALQKSESPQQTPPPSDQQHKGEKENKMDMYAPEKDKFRKEEGQQNQEQNPHQQSANQRKSPKPQNPRDEAVLDYIKEREKNTAKRALNKEDYSQPQKNLKDW